MTLNFNRTRKALREYDHDASTRMQALINACSISDRRNAHRLERRALNKVQDAFYLDVTPMVTKTCSEKLSIDFMRYVVNASNLNE